jgi:hypothetical protein
LKAKDPADGGMTGGEAATKLAEPTATVEVKDGDPVHAPLLKKANVTLPVMPVDGNPPVSVAWSVTDAPTVMVEDGLMAVVMDGVCLLTVRGSHVLDTLLLLLSPL